MTALDDALNSSAPVFAPPNLTADWAEQRPSEPTDGNPDSVRELGQQMTGEYTVTHSLDDGLPDPVTMTTSNEASGVLAVSLNGRDGVTAASSTWDITAGGFGVGGSVTTVFPSDLAPGDYIITAISLNSSTQTATPQVYAGEANFPWTVLADVSNGTGLRTLVYGRVAWSTALPLRVNFSGGASYSWSCMGVYARTANGTVVPMVPETAVATAEVSSVTSHAAGPATLTGRGWMLGVWSVVAATAQWTTTDTELDERTNVIDQMVSRTAQLDPGTYTLTATTTSATAVATKVAIPMKINDRPRMDAMQYFSPFNRNSPVYRFDRDTALTLLTFNVLTATGVVGTTLQRGQMADIGISGRSAELSGVSATRLNLAKSMVLPVVFGRREGCTIDWLATWIMARGGQFVGPAPTSYCVYWAPLYGSLHAHYDAAYGFNYGFVYDTSSPGVGRGMQYPQVVPGKFHSAIFGQQGATRTDSLFLNINNQIQRDTTLMNPNNIFSTAQNQGRVSFWLRGDPAVDAPSYAVNNYLMHWEILNKDSTGANKSGMVIDYRVSDRKIRVSLGGATSGFTFFDFTALPALPTDGAWHFISVAWNYVAGTVRAGVDGTEVTSSLWNTSGLVNPADLPATDAALVTAGGQMSNLARFRLPVSDVQQENRPFADSWSYMYPVAATPSSNAVARPTYQKMEVVAETTPVIGWDTLVELAQSSFSAYRTDEVDSYNFLPLSYFGEVSQMTPTEVVDTQVNASDLAVTLDPTKSRNAVTVNFDETRADLNYSPVLTITSSIELPRGYTTMVFALDMLVAEIHGALDGFGVWWTLTNLTSTQITTPTIPNNVHFMTANTAADGTGTVLTSGFVTAKIMAYDSSTVTIRFNNQTVKTAYIANNGNGVPAMQILGYAIRSAEGYVTERDPGAIGARQERALDTQLKWVHNREIATQLATTLVVTIARPRAEVTISVMGDPRRKPGQVVTIQDSEGTQASGVWRILSIKHNASGAQYTQDLKLVSIYPPFIWDQLPGWDYSVWGV
jgi:hypothetical protein